MICVTGHRPNKLGGYQENPIGEWVKQELRDIVRKLYDNGARDFMSGMALGVDQWFAHIVLDTDARLHCAIPFPSFHKRWPEQSQREYHNLLDAAKLSGGSITFVCDDPYAVWKMQKRNEYLVNRSDVVVAVWDGTDSGTANCVNYAMKQGKTIYRIDPISKLKYYVKYGALESHEKYHFGSESMEK